MKVQIWTDGAVRTGGKKGASAGHDGRASCAAVVKSEDGVLLVKKGVFLDTATVNEAEYSGLILGLHLAANYGASHVHVRMDSQLVINQMNGVWVCRENRLKDYLKEARVVAEQFEKVTYEWVRREYNQHADSITREVLDGRATRAEAEG